MASVGEEPPLEAKKKILLVGKDLTDEQKIALSEDECTWYVIYL